MDVISVVQTLCPVLAKADRLEDRLDVILVGSSRNVVVRGNTESGILNLVIFLAFLPLNY
jgi:hypothetical protein